MLIAYKYKFPLILKKMSTSAITNYLKNHKR